MLISPMTLAKELGIPPQKIYGLINKKRLPSQKENGKVVVDKEQAARMIGMTTRAPRAKTEKNASTGHRAHVNVGDIAHWARPRKERRVAQCTDNNDQLATFKDSDGKEITFLGSSLDKQIESGRVVLTSPEELLRMLKRQYELQDKPKLASVIRATLELLKQEESNNE